MAKALWLRTELEKGWEAAGFFQDAGGEALRAHASERWAEAVEPLLPLVERLRCLEIVERCRPLLEELAEEPAEGWGAWCYRVALSRVFPAPVKGTAAQRTAALCLLELLRLLLEVERRMLAFDKGLDFAFCTEEELRGSDWGEEYRRFLAAWQGDYVYETMRLGQEVTAFRTLEHIAGVHFVAMTVARELAAVGGEVDLALTSGAAAAHDIGKFGCQPGERVPYLHYYYSESWCAGHSIDGIGHIAANHSTWDLELENLSTESLLLIYADFRVKQLRDAEGREQTRFFPLKESYQVILDKLDNVDEEKRLRYAYVYEKLRDFENYLLDKGVDVLLTGHPAPLRRYGDPALFSPEETVAAFRRQAVEHNLHLMHRFGHQQLFANLLESARGSKSWLRVRAYLSVFEEYYLYLTPTQKAQTLSFLYELLMYREGDIRRQAAVLLGNILAGFNAGYKKELPAQAGPTADEQTQFALWSQYLNLLIYPDHKLTERQKSHIHYTLKIVAEAVLGHCESRDRQRFLEGLLRYYDTPEMEDGEACFALTDTLSYLPLEVCGGAALGRLAAFAAWQAAKPSAALRAAALRFFQRLAETETADESLRKHCGETAAAVDCGQSAALAYLRDKILKALGRESGGADERRQRDVVSDIFVENLKNATPWMLKAVNIRLLEEEAEERGGDKLLHIAAHFSNLIKVSDTVVVRYSAAASLLRIAPLLSYDQRNEVAVELAKGLEVGQYEYAKYIPLCLGEFAGYLRPAELDELLERLGDLLGSGNDAVVSAALTTVGAVLEHEGGYSQRFGEEETASAQRRRRMAGMLLKGLASYRESVRQEALWVIGQGLFASTVLAFDCKTELFGLMADKILFLLGEYREGELTYFYRAATLSHMYRFLIQHMLTRGGFPAGRRAPVAFFPGTFDPFTLSHKGIVREIRDMGFEVYLAVDEFSWSKKAQPSLIRRQIVSMSVADEFQVRLFPHDVPVNLANAKDLNRLRQLFAGRELYLAVGSDVVEAASSYRCEPTPGSVHALNHIVFRRATSFHGDGQEPDLSRISGKVLQLQLPTHLEDISSTRIRENVDLNRDISNLIDPVVEEFIYQNSLYLREPQYKPLLGANPLHFDKLARPEEGLVRRLCADIDLEEEIVAAICGQRLDFLTALGTTGEDAATLGFAIGGIISVAQLREALGSIVLADYVRGRTAGRILLLRGMVAGADHRGWDVKQLLLTEVLSDAMAQDCTYAIFCPADKKLTADSEDALLRQGFVSAPDLGAGRPLLLVDLRSPVAVMENMETTIKSPFSASPAVLGAVRQAHRRLQKAVCGLYPGSLVLSLNAGVIHHRLVEAITARNSVPPVPTSPRVLGPDMCVPFGKILRGHAVPNTVTKTIHTDKVYSPDLTEKTIDAFPYYAPLTSQVRTVQSFDRPVMLVDDLLHTGDRIRVLEPLARSAGVEIREVLVGLLSGRGKDLMDEKKLAVEGVYFVPDLRAWFVESSFYPFVGGDTVRREQRAVTGLLPAINMLLPYAYPNFLKACGREAAFRFSVTCLENARDILAALEAEYRAQFGRNLTLARLGEAVILPLCPDKGGCMSYDPDLAPSTYVENDLANLMRIRHLFDN